MKKLIFILILFSSFSFSQTLKGVYSITPITGIGDDIELSEKAKKSMYFSYTFSNNKSIQELISKESTSIDTTYITDDRIKDQKFETTSSVIKPYKTIYFKDYGKNIFRLESSIKNEDLVNEDSSIKDSIDVYNWTLENETRTIAGYTCKKATTNNKQITAWYNQDIPINDGPGRFNGLPGLILQIEIGNFTLIKFKKLKYFKDKNTKIEEPKNKAEMLTMKEYLAKKSNGR